MRTLAALAVGLALGPAGARAFEPRLDHRDEHGPLVELLAVHDTVAVAGLATEIDWRPALRIAYGLDVTGEGGELFLGAQARPWSNDPDRRRVLAALDLRYRGYFGVDELKTFFEAGIWAPVASRRAVGPLVGVGVNYDFSRAAGIYASAGFATAFGQARVVSISASFGAQLRFE